jgi:type I restriction enzyme M protein
MPSKRDVVAQFSREELVNVVDQFELEVADRRRRDGLVDAVAASRKATLVEILPELSRERLKELCRSLELDDSGSADAYHRDLHPDLKADFVLANPPFNDSDWGGDRLREDVRWKYGVPPTGNANFAWVQHFIHHLSPKGMASFVLANGSMSSNQSGEGDIRKAMVEADIVDCMVALPGQLFYSTQIPACLWFLAKNKTGGGKYRNRKGETLFIDARKLGTLNDRTQRELTDEDVAKIADTYHRWRGDSKTGEYEDIAGFCFSAKLADIEKHGFVLTPGRYVGAEEEEADDEPFADKMNRRASAEKHTKFAELSVLFAGFPEITSRPKPIHDEMRSHS